MFCVQRGICHKGHWVGSGVGRAKMASLNMNHYGDACFAPYFTIICHDFRHIDFRRSLEKTEQEKLPLSNINI